MRQRFFYILLSFVLCPSSFVLAQTLNISLGEVTYQFPSEQAGQMTYSSGTTLTVMGKTFTLSEIDNMYVDETEVTDNLVSIVYAASSASVFVAGNVAQYVSPTVSGAHVTIEQTNTDAVSGDEITYQLSGSTSNGSLILGGSYKCTVSLAGVTLTNPSGAAITITNSKRIQLSAKKNTVNTLTDGASGSQKACIYSKGQLQLQGNGTLNVVGKTKHGIKSASYISVKNMTLNITSTIGDGLNCEEYMELKSGTINLSGIGDDGIQCDLGGTSSTGITTDHEDEDTGNIYISGGTLTINCEYKGIKAAGDMDISDGSISVTSNAASTSSPGPWGSTSGSAPEAIESKGALTISGGQIYAKSSDDAINAGGNMTITGGYIFAYSTSNDGLDANGNLYIKGGLVYAIGSTSPEMAIDANTEGGKKLYISGGTVIAVGNLESGASITGGTAKQTTSWTANTWYALYDGDTLVAAFQTPAKSSDGGGYPGPGGPGGGGGGGGGGSSQKLIVYTSSTPSLKSGVTVSDGSSYFNGMANIGGSVSGGSSVSLSNYSSGGW